MLEQMRYYRSVVDNNSFTEAAEECSISQSAISQQIRNLEKELGGIQLLERGSRGFTVTEAGHLYYKYCDEILKKYEDICSRVKLIAHGELYEIRFMVLHNYQGRELERALEAFSRKYPLIPVRVSMGSYWDIRKGLIDGSIDMGLNEKRQVLITKYDDRILLEETFQICIPEEHPLAGEENVDIEDLEPFPCVLIAPFGFGAQEKQFSIEQVGLKGELLLADTWREGCQLAVQKKGFVPVLTRKKESVFPGMKTMEVRDGAAPMTRRLCAFWRRDNSGYYIEELADLIHDQFTGGNHV